MRRVLAVIASVFWLIFHATSSCAADIPATDVIWAELFDISQLYSDLPTDTEPEGKVDLQCQIISSDGNLKCRVVNSALDPDPDGEYSGMIARIVEHGGRIDMIKTRNAWVGKTVEFAVIVQLSDM